MSPADCPALTLSFASYHELVFLSTATKPYFRSSHCGGTGLAVSLECWDTGLIPGLEQWIKDPVLLQLRDLAQELPHAAGATKKKKRKKEKEKKTYLLLSRSQYSLK